MKSKAIIPFLLFFLLLTTVISSKNNLYLDGNDCVEVNGFLVYDGKKLEDIEVIIYESGKEVKRLKTQGKKNIKFTLPKNHFYSVVLKKEGFLDAVFIISTELPKVITECGFSFDFEYDMIPDNHSLNKEYTDYPAAVVKYSKSTEGFDISTKYNSHIKKLLGAK